LDGDYGVHRFYNSGTKPDPDALDKGQIVTVIIFDFVREMGADPNLINEMIKAGGKDMNVLPDDKLASLRVNTPHIPVTRWELVTEGRLVKAKGIIDAGIDGRHLIEFACGGPVGQQQLTVLMRHNAREARYHDNGMPISTWLLAYGSVITKSMLSGRNAADLAYEPTEVALQADEVLVQPWSSTDGISIVLRATPRILSLLQTTDTFGIKFSSKTWTASFSSNFEEGRKLVLDFAETCKQ
jgi:hypothetical protein